MAKIHFALKDIKGTIVKVSIPVEVESPIEVDSIFKHNVHFKSIEGLHLELTGEEENRVKETNFVSIASYKKHLKEEQRNKKKNQKGGN